MGMMVKELPVADRPREKLLAAGAKSLTEAELLAILLRTGVRGKSVLELAQGLLVATEDENTLARAGLVGSDQSASRHLANLRFIADSPPEDLATKVPGIGLAKACQLVAAFEIGRRIERLQVRRAIIRRPEDAGQLALQEIWPSDREQFKVILLNTKNHVINVESVSEGTLNAAIVHPREVFKPAIRRSANAVILAHNHPSGDPQPSREDHEITKRLHAAGQMLDIAVLDHIVVGDGVYYSFREEGLLRT